MLQCRVAVLQQQFGYEKIKKAMKWYLASRASGRPKKWTEIRLISLWFIVRVNLRSENDTVVDSCCVVESQGGIFDSFDYELKVRNRLVTSRGRIHRLYYAAEAVLYDMKLVNDCNAQCNKQASTLREKLCRLAEEMVARDIIMCPVISIAEAYVMECIKTEKEPNEIIENADQMWVTVDLSALKLIPDGNNLWRIRGICT